MTDALVTRQDKDGCAILTLNRPDKLNALTVGMFRELRAHVSDLYKDDTIGCVVLRGAGKCFSAGHDLADIAEGFGASLEERTAALPAVIEKMAELVATGGY